MLNKEKHQLIMGRILKDIYADVFLASMLGFKGGTCAYFFYGLPRFSVDLDFDLLEISEENKKIVFEKIVKILRAYGEIKDQYIKRYTIFALLSYGDADHNIKIEISTRPISDARNCYEMKNYLGIAMLAGKKEYLFAGKLSALTLRTETAMRDVYDIYYFAKNNWEINEEFIKERTGKPLKEYLVNCVGFIEKIKDNEILQGLGELVCEKEKIWIRKKLKSETVFMLNNYISVMQ